MEKRKFGRITCPFCGAAKSSRIEWATETTYDYACGTEGVPGGEYLRSNTCYEMELSALKKLVREMVPHLKYLMIIPEIDTVSWTPGKLTKKVIQAILTDSEVKKIMEEK